MFNLIQGTIQKYLKIQANTGRDYMPSKCKIILTAILSFVLIPSYAIENPNKIQSILPAFEKSVNTMLEESHVPGVAIGIVSGDKIVFMKGFGVRDIETKEAVDTNTIFPIGSLSKAFTGVTMAKLVSQGKVKWDDKVISYLPHFKLYDPWVTKEITIRDLLSHRSGLTTHTGDILQVLGYNREQIINRLQYVKPTSSFRSRWDYQNSMFAVAGELAGKVSGKTWDNVIAEQIFTPLNMNSSSARMADFHNAKNKITTYRLVNNKPEKNVLDLDDTFAPSGGVSTTISDMMNWMIMELNKGKYKDQQIINKDALAETQSPQIVMSKNPEYKDKFLFYGLGVVVEYDDQGHTYIQHSGALDGIRSYFAFIPNKKIGIVVFANAFPNALPEAITHTFLDLYFTGKTSKDWLAYDNKAFTELLKSIEPKAEATPPKNLNNKTSLPLEKFIGHYRNNYLGDIEVTKDKDSLILTLLTPKQLQLKLEHWNGDQFATQTDGSVNIITFTKSNAEISHLKIDGFTNDVDAVFKRIK